MHVYIRLARVAIGKTAPNGYAELLEACRRTKRDGRALFPLSATHLMEMADVPLRKRADVAQVMEELSDFHCLLGRPIIMRLEVESALDGVLGNDPSAGEVVPLLGQGIFWPFEIRPGLHLLSEEAQATARMLREQVGNQAFDQIMADINRDAERDTLIGLDHESAVDTWHSMLDKRAEREIGQVQLIDGDEEDWRKGRLRDLMSAAEMYVELNEMVANAPALRDTDLADVLPDVATARNFTDGMPSTRVAVSLKAYLHRDGQHNWTTNDIHDIDALAVAVPYCHAVFADKAMRNGLVSSRELDVFRTELPRKPHDLTEWLNALPVPHQPS
jgi:hypothetical protein